MKGELDEMLIKVEKWVDKYIDESYEGKNVPYFKKVRQKRAMFDLAENLLLRHLRKCRVKHIRSVQKHSHKSLDYNSK